MFKPVTGKDLQNFDEETIELYKKRANDDRVSFILSMAKRPERNHLPVVVSNASENPYLVNAQKQHDSFPRYMIMLCLAFSKYHHLLYTRP